MKSKLITSILFASIFLVFSLAAVSANIAITSTAPTLTLTESSLSQSFTLTTNDLANLTVTNPSSSVFSVSPMLNDSTNLTTFTVSTTAIALGVHSYTFTINATNSTNSTDFTSQTVNVILQNNSNPFCSGVSNQGRLLIDELELNVLDGFGDEDDDFLYPLDEVEITFNVENDGDFDVKDVEISACVRDLDSTTLKCIFDEEDMEISLDSFDLDSGDDQDIILTLSIDPDKLNAGNTNYAIFVSAKGKVNDRDSSFNRNATCTSDSLTDLEIRTDETFVVINNIATSDTVKCGDLVEMSAEIWNIGDEDLDKDEVYVLVYNQELGIRQTIALTSDLESMDKQNLEVNFKLPANAVAKTYAIEFSVYDDEDMSSNDIYQNSEDDDARYTGLLTVGNCAPVSVKSAAISAGDFQTLNENVRPLLGRDTTFKLPIKNTGNIIANFTVSIIGNDAWSVATLDPTTFTSGVGETKNINLYLQIKPDVNEGNKTFSVVVKSEGAVLLTQEFSIPVEKGLTMERLLNHIKTNWVIYTIVLVNLILIIAIILVVRSLLRK